MMKPSRKLTYASAILNMCVLFVGAIMMISCQKESKGFILPPGDIERGKTLFTELSCTDCHSIGEIPWKGAAGDPNVKLGGNVTKLKLYGELVTSVINPSHKISQRNIADPKWVLPGGTSKMETYCYNEVMTVQQLIDVIAFLQSKYNLVVPINTYPYY